MAIVNGGTGSGSGGSVPAPGATYPLGTDAYSNMAVGSAWASIVPGAGASNANNDTAVGYQALFANTTGNSNTAVGSQALQANTTGTNNTAVGYEALFANTTGGSNTAVGLQALHANKTGNNTAVGYQALYSNTTGGSNTAVGLQVLFANTTGANSTAVGYQSGYAPNGVKANATVLGVRNVFIGYETGSPDASDPSDATAIGCQALATGSGVAIGSGAQATASNAVAIGKGVVASAANQMLLGTTSHLVTIGGWLLPQQAATASAPAYMLGAIYFDTTLNKLRVGGASGWETITST